MRTIWKFPILGGWFEQLPMPRGAKILHVADQGGIINLWAEVDTTAERVRRTVVVVGTGHSLPEGDGSHIGTVMQGQYVWHIYIEDETPAQDPRVFGAGDPADEYADPARPA